MNLYTADEVETSFIVDASISWTNGEPYYNSTNNKQTNSTEPFIKLFIDIEIAELGLDLVAAANVSVNSTANVLQFSLEKIPPRAEPYLVTIVGASVDGNQSYTAETHVSRLPERTDGGSVVKIDNLYQGLLVQEHHVGAKSWEPIYPYSFYVSWDGYAAKSPDSAQDFKDKGYNIIHVVPDGGLPNKAFNFTAFNLFLDKCDEVGLWVMYDMRWTFKNLTSVQEQVDMIKNRKSLLLWYTGDERKSVYEIDSPLTRLL